MEHARPPAELSLDGGPANRADAWRKWLKQFKVFLKASGVYKEPKDMQASLLINLIGPEGYDIFSTFKFDSESDRDDIEKLIEKYNGHFGTKPNTTMVRFKFFTRNQEEGESIDEYVTALKLLSQQCEFEQLEDGLIRDRIVCGVRESTVRDRLLRSDQLTLEKAIVVCQSNEISNEEGRKIEGVKHESKGASVDAVWSSRGAWRGARGGGGGGWAHQRWCGGAAGGGRGRGVGARALPWPSAGSSGSGDAAVTSQPARDHACTACSNAYCDSGFRCPARNVKCFLCGNKGHYRKMCTVRSNRVFQVQEDKEDDLYYISTVGFPSDSRSEDKWYENLILMNNMTKHQFKLDTGADLNVISKNDYLKLGFTMSDLSPIKPKAVSYCGSFLPIVGSCAMKWMYKNKVYCINFIISDHNCESILGKLAMEEINLVQRVYCLDMDNFGDLFEGLGRLPGQYTIPVDKDSTPCICPVRKIPIGLREKLQIELKRMEEMGVIRKVTHPTPWVNAIVVAAKKDGNIRVCLDPRPLNKVIRRQHFPLPTLMEIATQLKGAMCFSKLDARSGFWMISLDDESADLCTFGTPFGRFQYLRLPYGINSASEVFHCRVKQLLEGLEGVDSFVDDVIVWGSDERQHDERLKLLMERAREVGIKFNREKCEFKVSEVTYLGHKFSAEGMQIDESKLKAIKEMPCPKNRQELERFLGMVNFLCKFIPNFSEKATPLRNLLKKNNEWQWGASEDEVVKTLKNDLCCAPVLALFAATEPAVVSVDASWHALGAVLLQNGRPVEFASLTLTETQQRYAQIEKEMLAIVFALERFHQYVYGKSDVVVETDHKPLETLFKKSLNDVPARLQRMMLRVQRYDFTAMYKPGKYMYVADALSRAPISELMHEKVSDEVQSQSCFLIQNVSFSDEKINLVREHSKRDVVCQLLIRNIKEGWPLNKHETDERVRSLWDHRDVLEYYDGILFKNDLVFIPEKLRGDMIGRIHEGHLGIDRCKRRAREVMYWPGMAHDIERAVRRCRVCARHAALPQREPLIAQDIPSLPWIKLGSDIFEYKKIYFLVLVDYFSNYVEVCPLTNITTKSVIKAMKDQFARHGIPHELITDNGPAYASKEFHDFATIWGFSHNTSSPNYAQSNGRSERAVRTIKTLLKKSLDDGSDFYISLLNYRTAPRDGIASPSELLMGRKLNTRLPIHLSKLNPARNNETDYDNIVSKQAYAKSRYDAHARELPALNAGDEVIAMDGSRRREAKVTGRAAQPRSYFVKDNSGRIYRRNRRHLLKVHAPSDESVRYEDDGMCESDSSVYDDTAEEICTDNIAPTNTIAKNVELKPTGSTDRAERVAAREAKKRILDHSHK